MTNEEAIEMLKQWNEDLSAFEDEKDGIECHKLAISAIKKQIPKKPKIRKAVFRKDTKMHTCRCCGAGIILTDRYCCNCGQAIDRRDI